MPNKDYYFHKLPVNCKNFLYINCPGRNNEFLNFCKCYKSKGIAIYKRFIDKIHEKIFMCDQI